MPIINLLFLPYHNTAIRSWSGTLENVHGVFSNYKRTVQNKKNDMSKRDTSNDEKVPSNYKIDGFVIYLYILC